MTRINFFLIVSATFLLCQGCTSSSSVRTPRDNAKLVDLGNGMCRQSNGLMWQVERTDVFTSGQEALAYVDGLSLGDYDDWRLPTKEELYDLCVLYDMKWAGDCPMRLKGSYWMQNGTSEAGEWDAYPLCGGSDYQYFKTRTGRVRAVRP